MRCCRPPPPPAALPGVRSDGGWVVLADKDYREHGLPRELSQSLAEHKKQQIAIRCVAFDCRGDWFLLDARNNCFTSNPGHAAVAKIKNLQSVGEAVRLIAFTPGVYVPRLPAGASPRAPH